MELMWLLNYNSYSDSTQKNSICPEGLDIGVFYKGDYKEDGILNI